jgi:hypothetical protein
MARRTSADVLPRRELLCGCKTAAAAAAAAHHPAPHLALADQAHQYHPPTDQVQLYLTRRHLILPLISRCPGGDQLAGNSADVAKRGLCFSCFKATPPSATHDTESHVAAKGLTTKSSRASKHTECFPLPGWFLFVATQNAQEASMCSGASYSPGFARIRACLPCQAGLVLDDASAADAQGRQAGGLQ